MLYSPVRPFLGSRWMVGGIVDHTARPLTHAEVESACAVLNAPASTVDLMRNQHALTEVFLAERDRLQRRIECMKLDNELRLADADKLRERLAADVRRLAARAEDLTRERDALRDKVEFGL